MSRLTARAASVAARLRVPSAALGGAALAILLASTAPLRAEGRAEAGEPTASPQGAQAEATPQELRNLGFALLEAGNLTAAAEVAEALLLRDAKDPAALMLRAQINALAGREVRARRDAREAWYAAQNPSLRYSSALFVAQSLASDGYFQRGQFWLRRAAQAADSPEQDAVLADAFAVFRARSPLKYSLNFALRPSDNVNNGSTAASFGLPWGGFEIELPVQGAQKALSGEIATVSGELTWRLPPTATRMDALHLRFVQSKVWLSSAAKAIAPEARAGDYDSARLEIGASRRWRPEGQEAIWTFGLFAAHEWSGGEDFANLLRGSVQLEHRLTAKTAGFAQLSYEDQHRLDGMRGSGGTTGLRFGAMHQLASGDIVTAAMGLRAAELDSPGLHYHSRQLQLGWQKAEPLWGMGIEAWASLEERDYPDSPWKPGTGRQDLRSSIDLSVEFRELHYMGFSPKLDLSLSRVSSNVGLYDSRESGLQLGFTSAF